MTADQRDDSARRALAALSHPTRTRILDHLRVHERQVSRDKLLSSGQSIKTTGETFGVYLFRATSEAARDGEPWVEAVVQAHQSSPQLPPAGWYADPNVDEQMRRWDGARWTTDVKPGPVARLTDGTADEAGAAPDGCGR